MSNEIPTKARQVIRARQEGACAMCGNTYTALHHRMRRREGGHGYENLVGLCDTCHRFVHANPKVAQERGYIVPIHVGDIGSVPLKSYMGWVLFDSDGEVYAV